MKPNYYTVCTGCGKDVHTVALDLGLSMTVGNALKYLIRAGKKDPDKEIEDLQKARQCLKDEIKYLKKHPRSPTPKKTLPGIKEKMIMMFTLKEGATPEPHLEPASEHPHLYPRDL